ncbi:LysM peptidoglycan-binding domain-containing protein [Hymenobacter sp. BT635]|uniref:LysM peptidoglycan-binding domain-containing protein n=1 Tax=Hymenobacter nitidus TaxID=2880929 RepID=A0ABS8AIU8_9BACT|nr:LysM domain-containing protein [Hymenobacter nitidus]MCB2379791.1 LysM peptidoglycan-binding domain-containing protein [Hymenobacter nitidus]
MIQVSDGQSLLDICLQELGTVAVAPELATANGLRITSALQAGQRLVIPASLASRPDIAAYFASRQQRINTGQGSELLPVGPDPEPVEEGPQQWDNAEWLHLQWF